MSCSVCRVDFASNVAWGCTARAPHPFAQLKCWGARCESRPWPTCPHCKGTGRVELFDCPNRTVAAVYRQVVISVVEAEDGTWPVAGGTYDQAAWWLEARGILLPMIREFRTPKKS